VYIGILRCTTDAHGAHKKGRRLATTTSKHSTLRHCSILHRFHVLSCGQRPFGKLPLAAEKRSRSTSARHTIDFWNRGRPARRCMEARERRGKTDYGEVEIRATRSGRSCCRTTEISSMTRSSNACACRKGMKGCGMAVYLFIPTFSHPSIGVGVRRSWNSGPKMPVQREDRRLCPVGLFTETHRYVSECFGECL
jgi:hypothetical protein